MYANDVPALERLQESPFNLHSDYQGWFQVLLKVYMYIR